ncbi:MAG: inorganic phosphate transporter family protein [Thermoplasmata archaeon]|nr:inorganic phosphate transporter family protein [Thermoplasmata archaeon]
MTALGVDLLLLAAFAFAASIGAHYTGACMGMPYAARAITAKRALLLMALLAFVGAALASRAVEQTVGHGILGGGPVTIGLALSILVVALALTSAYNFLALPTSTIQILVFSAVGAGLAAGVPVHWSTIGTLLLVWASAPLVAIGAGYLVIRIIDRWKPAASTPGPLAPMAAAGLVAVGAGASFAMGANDVANASGAFVMTGVLGLFAAALVGGVGLAMGILTWGRPLLERVAFGLVRLDPRMAIASQLVQAGVILAFVTVGYFTSINQALVGAMVGVGLARQRSTVKWATIRDLLGGWALGPTSGLALGFALTWVLRTQGWV